LELIADTYLSVELQCNGRHLSLLASRESIQSQNHGARSRNLAFLLDQIVLRHPGACSTVEGGWYAIIQVPRIRSEEDWVLSLLAEDQVLVQTRLLLRFRNRKPSWW